MLMLDDYDPCTDNDLLRIIKLLKLFLQIIQILVPIGLILMGSIDLGKAVMSSNEDNIKKGQKSLIRRCIAAVLVFLVVMIVNFITGFVGSDSWKACWTNEPTPTTVDESNTGNTDETDTDNTSDPNGGGGGFTPGTSNGGGGQGSSGAF